MLRQLLRSSYVRQTNFNRFVSSQDDSSKSGFKTPAPIVDYEDPPHLPVPEYPLRPDEPLETRKQRLLYQSRKRGMLENDLLLSTFVAKYLKDFNASQTAQYDELINGVTNDWDIYYWATGAKPTPSEYDTEIMKLLKEHVKNAERVQRIRQPEL